MHLPALLSSGYEGALVDFESAPQIEARWFTKVLMTDTALTWLEHFRELSALEKGKLLPKRRI